MLIKLYALPPAAADENVVALCRKPIAPENDLLAEWVGRHFSPGWAAEVRAGLCNRPVSVFVAVRSAALIGFCCYDATARGLVGPIGVLAEARGSGIGSALLRACLNDMHASGYRYAVAGAVGAPGFFRRAAAAVEIQDSTPGLYRDMLRP
jgi:GNAT superfamily N-acetyltransferase